MKKHSKIRASLFGTLGFTFVVGLVVACSDSSAKVKPNLVYKEPPRSGVVAKIGGEIITEEALVGDAKLEFHDIKKREYDLKMARLNALMVEKLIGAEAKKANMSTDDYIDKKITKGKLKVSDSEYQQFVKEKRIPESQINPQLKTRIMTYLQEKKKEDLVNAHIAAMTKKNPVEVYFKKPKIQINVELGSAPTWGKKDAPVTIIEFSDFQCPFCARAAKTVTDIKKKYGSKVNIAFRHFPLSFHRQARPAAEASMCVHEQGEPKFWKFHDLVFDNQKELDNASLEKYAKKAGVNVQKYQECMTGKRYSSLIQKDLDYGEKIGVKSTPTFFVNGELVSGAVPYEQFAEIVDEALSETN